MADDKRIERIETKIDDIADHLSSIDITLSAQHISLKEHIRRTTLLEQELRPVKKHVMMVEGAFKLIGIMAAIAAIYEAIRMALK